MIFLHADMTDETPCEILDVSSYEQIVGVALVRRGPKFYIEYPSTEHGKIVSISSRKKVLGGIAPLGSTYSIRKVNNLGWGCLAVWGRNPDCIFLSAEGWSLPECAKNGGNIIISMLE